jgi:uncharacterized protein (DUF302 family)
MNPKLTTVPSPYTFPETVSRVERELEQRGVPIFARIDHARNAREAGLEMPETLVLSFGAARGGTPVMLAEPDIAYELPLRILVRERDGRVELLYRAIDVLAAEYDVPGQVTAPLHLVEQVVAATTAPSD